MALLRGVTLDKAARLLNSALKGRALEEVDLLSSCGKYLGEDITADMDVPHFSRSTVDGYAVRSQDTLGCSESLPALFKEIGAVEMGEETTLALNRGETVYVPTGGMLPKNADSVVMIEYSEKIGKLVALNRPCAVKENAILSGTDIKKGTTVIRTGEKLSARHIGAAAACGKEKVKVFKKLTFAVISGGDELCDASEMPKIGQMRDINTHLICGAIKELGHSVNFLRRVRDEESELSAAIDDAVKSSDVIVLSGGTSAGRRDITAEVIGAAGKVLCHGLALKPGKPTIVAEVKGRAVLGLPGHPMAAYMAFIALFDRAYGIYNGSGSALKAKSTMNFPAGEGKTTLIPVKIFKESSRLCAEPIFAKSGMVSVLCMADGFALIDEKSEGVSKGDELTVYPFSKE